MNSTDLFTPVSPHSVKKYNIKRIQNNKEDNSEIESKHIKAYNDAKELKQYDSFNISFLEYEKFRDEWLKDK
jgi:hypothetical protein